MIVRSLKTARVILAIGHQEGRKYGVRWVCVNKHETAFNISGTQTSSLSRLQTAVAICCSTHKLYAHCYSIAVDEATLHLSSPKPSGIHS
ncbi:hypothetical protein VNO77_30631 [Canavalia gladiata]|uniref:Uncharacterized protein n=1 Tax=Canavalia gladiata TaxID=3824 RepID=A0AAN9Q7C3_CANGL